jgi:signal transduction histidine kinase/DNA-binding response OmpR family regulator
MSDRGRLWQRTAWLAANKIPLRIGSLSAVLLGALVMSTVFLVYDLHANQRLAERAHVLFHRLELAARAERNFDTIRYWLTDLSVSLLTLSERRANEARDELSKDLADIGRFAPEAAQAIRDGADAYFEQAMEAADAYTEGHRLIGNMHLAQARMSSDKVVASLGAMVATFEAEANQAYQTATAEAHASKNRAIVACVIIVVAGALLTWLILRSILRPLARVDDAIASLHSGRTDLDLPPEGNDEFGRIARTLRTLRDSQQARRELEAAAEQQRNTILTAIETIPDGFALYDRDSRLVLVNQRYRQIFHRLDDLLTPGRPFAEILRAQAERDVANMRGKSVDEWLGERIAWLSDPARPNQNLRVGDAWIRTSKRNTPEGGTVLVYSDITDLVNKQNELEDARAEAEGANEAKSRFLASMSHELRTPLNAIIGYSEMLIEDAEDQGLEDAADDLNKIMASGRHLLALINDILDLSKIEAGKMEVYIERFSLQELLDDVRETVVPLIAKNENTLSMSVDVEPDEIASDRTKLRQNLFNLLSNAAKFTEHGSIDLSVRRFDADGRDMLEFCVRDTGIGMTPAQQQRLFQAFVQADSSTTRNYGGTGLGLTITKEFVQLLGGDMDVESAPGVGSTFTFRVPAIANELRGEAGSGDAEAGGGERRGTVLVIDDEQVARRSVTDLVEKEGYAVVQASNAEAGLDLARKARPDAIILDIIMPERDGWYVLRELKSDPELERIPVILVTVVADRDMGLAFGATDHLTKPIDPALLVRTLNDVVGDGRREVLVVDDDPATRKLFHRTLARQGWHVREAADGRQALSQLEAHCPTVMVLDLMMPNLDGFEVLKQLSERPEFASLHVIVATAKDLSRSEVEWLQSKAGDVIRKGQDGRAELVAALKRHLVQKEPPQERTA